MKIPGFRQHLHLPRVAVHSARIVAWINNIVEMALHLRHRSIRQQIEVGRSIGDALRNQMNHIFRAALDFSLHQHQPRANDFLPE